MKTIDNCHSLYIHIPFCKHICNYCDFTKLFYNSKFSKPYIDELLNEIDSYNIDKVDTIYIGGGTPTSLSDEEFERILEKVAPYLNKNGEFTVEANIENLTTSKLSLMKKYGVTRLSIGVESTSNELLKKIGRHHSFEEAVKVVNEAKKYDFDSINVDLIYGFEGQSEENLIKDLENILKLDTDHISIYSLIVSPGTMFYNKHVSEQNEEDSRKFYEIILKELRNQGYKRYEISNFARNNKFSRHNITYWKDLEYYGVGLGASGYVKGVRYTNTRNLDEYLKGKHIHDKEIVTKDKDIEYYLLTNLRMEDGFMIRDFIDKFSKEDFDRLMEKSKEFILEGLIIVDQNNFRLSDDGLMIMDHILVKII